MQAKDIMSVGVATVSPETPVAEVARLLLQRQISGVPVVDAESRLLGIVSEGDLMFRAETGTEQRRPWWVALFTAPQEAAASYLKTHGVRAADVMTREVITVTEETPLEEIAALFAERRIKRVPVVRDDRIVGIVSRADLLRGLVAAQPETAVTADDRTLRQRLYDKLRAQDWAAGIHFNLMVTDGIVHLWGIVDSDEQRRAATVAAETTPGVRGVVNHLAVTPVAHYGWS